jgi:hypothetical protein
MRQAGPTKESRIRGKLRHDAPRCCWRRGPGERVEALIDEILAESFPASDPPSWGAAGARLRAWAPPLPLQHRLDDAPGVFMLE